MSSLATQELDSVASPEHAGFGVSHTQRLFGFDSVLSPTFRLSSSQIQDNMGLENMSDPKHLDRLKTLEFDSQSRPR